MYTKYRNMNRNFTGDSGYTWGVVYVTIAKYILKDSARTEQ